MTNIFGTSAVALIIFTACPAHADGMGGHDDEISFFAKAIAIARTVEESCPGFTFDDRFLEAIRLRMHV